MDKVKRLSSDLSVYNSVWYLQKKADTIILRVQQALGRTASPKSQYMTVNYGETFNKKHIRMLSVVLFLGCVSSAAVGCGIHYAFYWKPCTKKFLYEKTNDNDATCATEVHDLWDEYASTEKDRSSACIKCFKSQQETSLPQEFFKEPYLNKHQGIQ
ncbi:uncharacterized protein LOC123545384 [Mercenaria mercenaria]|uniref:uncharacterized protein LOC123545384 n=1 Tax=Mercenaria mercenaria TaxID=6596 RepID=UPI001E1D2548|nr:uncharacterized protein LOC123545384 [Mercenaria mercenaria]